MSEKVYDPASVAIIEGQLEAHRADQEETTTAILKAQAVEGLLRAADWEMVPEVGRGVMLEGIAEVLGDVIAELANESTRLDVIYRAIYEPEGPITGKEGVA